MTSKIRHEPIYSNHTGRSAYIWSDDGGETWRCTLTWLHGRMPVGKRSTTLPEKLSHAGALAKGEAWVAGACITKVKFEVAA